MELEQSHIDLLKRGFAELKSKNDLAALLSIAGKILYGKNFNPIPLSTLCYYANPNLSKKRYQSFEIKKKSGGLRIINAPTKRLKTILQSLNLILQCVYEPQKFATGFVKGLSIVDNANVHIGNRYVYNLDLKDFFHSFDRNRVKMGLLYDPIYMGKEKEKIAFFIACLCTHPLEVDGAIKTVLPQGSPTSPILTNILCKKLDRRLKGLANRFGANYTRYADDITFSSIHNIYNDIIFKNELKTIIEDDQNLFINPTKTRLQKVGTRQEVTGLIVNEKTNVQRKYIKQIRMWLYYWEKYGYEKAEQIFRRDYIKEKGHVKNINARLQDVLDGKLRFLRMVKGPDDSTYIGYKERFYLLSHFTVLMNQVLDLWESIGIEKAMDLFYCEKELINMDKDKYDFILNLLENKKLNLAQKERIIKLSILETKKDGTKKDEEILKRIEKLEKKLKKERNKKHVIIKQKLKPKHKPKDTYELLNYFSSTDGGMKNLTHSFNYGFIAYNELMKKCKEEFEQGKKEYPNVPEALLKRIENFAFSENPNWFIMRGDEKIVKKIGWSEPKFIEWYKEKKIHPSNDAFYNSEMILPFKETIQVRSDIGNLTKLINELSEKVFQNETKPILKDAIHTAQFYTDVDRLGLAIYHIFEAIRKASSKNFCDEIEIDFEIHDGIKTIKIVHIDSTPTKSVNDFDFLGGDLSSVKNNLWGLCNYDILAKFREGEFRKVILSDNPIEIEKNKVTGKSIGKNYKIAQNVKGFTHVLKFY